MKTKEFLGQAGVSLSTAIRMESEGVFQPRPKRLKRTKARIWTDQHVAQAKKAKEEEEEAPEPTSGRKGRADR